MSTDAPAAPAATQRQRDASLRRAGDDDAPTLSRWQRNPCRGGLPVRHRRRRVCGGRARCVWQRVVEPSLNGLACDDAGGIETHGGSVMVEFTEITSGLRFPEGPIAMPDGSVILVEMFGPCITRVHIDGTKELLADIPGGPNGAAIGPDGALYICNNGGCFTAVDMDGMLSPGTFDPTRYCGGRIQTARPVDRRADRSVHRVRRAPIAGPERSGLRRARRVLVHRPAI